MQLSGKQLEQVQKALESAFPQRAKLSQFVRFNLEEQLSIIADGQTQSELIFQLLEWAESSGRLFELVKKAHETEPGNLRLRECYVQLAQTQATLEASAPASTVPSGATTPPASKAPVDDTLLGQEHHDILARLRDTWLNNGPVVCFVEGFSGVGKTSLAHRLMATIDLPSVLVEMPEAASELADNLLLSLGTQLADLGYYELANAVSAGTDLPVALRATLSKPVLIVIDEFHRSFTNQGGTPVQSITSILQSLGGRPGLRGRLLCLSNQLVGRSRWSEPHEIHRLHGLEPEVAEHLLERLLNEVDRESEVPYSRRRDVVMWLDGNPRALRVLVASLEFDDLDTLIGLTPESWEARDRPVSAELLYRLEHELLARTLSHLSVQATTFLQQFSVYRGAVQREGIDLLVPGGADASLLREELIRKFLLEQHYGWFSLHPIAREIALQQLKAEPAALRRAHALAARNFTRHFTAKNIVSSGHLAGYFVEARYHLVQADDLSSLGTIVSRFGNYLRATYHATSPLPETPAELNERIALLAGFLQAPGPRGLEHYLARLFTKRNHDGDLQQAFVHAERSARSGPHEQAWLLYARLGKELNGIEEALRIYREGINRVPPERNVFALYQSCAELLSQARRTDEGITLLREGINRVPPEHSLFSLYESCAQLLAQEGRVEEAITLLQEGIQRVPIEMNGYRLVEALMLLYLAWQDLQSLEEYLARMDEEDRQFVLGNVLALQMRDDWERAATTAHEGSSRFPRYGAFYYAEAFSWLCSGNAQAALEALKRARIDPNDQGHHAHWLYAFAALRAGDSKQAEESLSYYLGRPLKGEEPVAESLLLGLWRAAAESIPHQVLANVLPVLPTVLTGLPTTITTLSGNLESLPKYPQ